MGSNLEESTQNILDSYLEETLEGNDDFNDNEPVEDFFRNGNSSDDFTNGIYPSVHANREVRLC